MAARCDSPFPAVVAQSLRRISASQLQLSTKTGPALQVGLSRPRSTHRLKISKALCMAGGADPERAFSAARRRRRAFAAVAAVAASRCRCRSRRAALDELLAALPADEPASKPAAAEPPEPSRSGAAAELRPLSRRQAATVAVSCMTCNVFLVYLCCVAACDHLWQRL